MSDGDEIDRGVRELVAYHRGLPAEASPIAASLADEMPLAVGGVGLDSIALVELLLDCEQRFGLRSTAELLAGPPLTVGDLVAHVRSCRAGGA